MSIARKSHKLKYLLAIIFYLLTANYAFSAYKRPYEEYQEYQLDIESELYDIYDEEEEIFYDPWEGMNRKIFDFNIGFNRYVTEPVGKAYRFITTKGIRRSVDNALKNLRAPVNLMNSIFQLDADNSARVIFSFLINSTVGVLGLFNPAAKLDAYNRDADFGQTLGKWNVGPGPYLVVPIYGPTTIRDGSGVIVERLIDPIGYNALGFGGERWESLVSWKFRVIRLGVYALNVSNFVVETFTPLIETSFDPYVLVRNGYLQARRHKINRVRKTPIK